MTEHAVFMGWKAVIAIFWVMMLCSRVDRCQFVACFCLHGCPRRAYSSIRKSKWKKLLSRGRHRWKENIKMNFDSFKP